MTATETTAESGNAGDEPVPALLHALRRTEAAVAAMRSGDPEPYIACWAESEDATLVGAWGPIEKGSQALFDTFRWVGCRYAGDPMPVKATVEHTLAASSGDLAYTVGLSAGQSGSIASARTRWSSASPTSTVAPIGAGSSSIATLTSRSPTSASNNRSSTSSPTTGACDLATAGLRHRCLTATDSTVGRSHPNGPPR